MPTAPGRSAATELARWPDRPVSATVAPAVARAEAMASPSPLVPPVTSTFIGIPLPTSGAPARRPWPSAALKPHDHEARVSSMLEAKPQPVSGPARFGLRRPEPRRGRLPHRVSVRTLRYYERAGLVVTPSTAPTVAGVATSSSTWTGSPSAPGCGPPACPSEPSDARPTGIRRARQRAGTTCPVGGPPRRGDRQLAELQENLKLIDRKIDLYRGRLAAGDTGQRWAPNRPAGAR